MQIWVDELVGGGLENMPRQERGKNLPGLNTAQPMEVHAPWNTSIGIDAGL